MTQPGFGQAVAVERGRVEIAHADIPSMLDDIIDQDVFRVHLEDAGQFIGIGRFRPRNNEGGDNREQPQPAEAAVKDPAE